MMGLNQVHLVSIAAAVMKTLLLLPPMILPLEERCDVPVEVRLLDEKEEVKVLKFVHGKCCCQLNNNSSWSDLFHIYITCYREMRNQCAELDCDSLDVVVMSQIMALMSNSTMNKRMGSQTEDQLHHLCTWGRKYVNRFVALPSCLFIVGNDVEIAGHAGHCLLEIKIVSGVMTSVKRPQSPSIPSK